MSEGEEKIDPGHLLANEIGMLINSKELSVGVVTNALLFLLGGIIASNGLDEEQQTALYQDIGNRIAISRLAHMNRMAEMEEMSGNA